MLGDLEHARVEGRLDAAFDDQRVAVADLDALQLDVRADDQLRLAARVGSLGRRDGGVRRGRVRGRRGGGGDRRGRAVEVVALLFALSEESVFL